MNINSEVIMNPKLQYIFYAPMGYIYGEIDYFSAWDSKWGKKKDFSIFTIISTLQHML
jgi:hypothetical protein